MSESEKLSMSASARTMSGAVFLTLYEQAENLIEQANVSACAVEERQRELLKELEKQNTLVVEQYKNNLKRYHEAFLQTLNQQHGSIIELSDEFKRHTAALEKIESRLRLFLPAVLIVVMGISFAVGFFVGR